MKKSPDSQTAGSAPLSSADPTGAAASRPPEAAAFHPSPAWAVDALTTDAARASFDEPHSYNSVLCEDCAGIGTRDGKRCPFCNGTGNRNRSGRMSIKRSHRAEGHNWVD